jgi:hypothetical protein
MKEHYDFFGAVRGKFYNASAVFELPVYLDERVQGYLAAKAQAKGIDLSVLVNDLLKREIELVEAMGKLPKSQQRFVSQMLDTVLAGGAAA